MADEEVVERLSTVCAKCGLDDTHSMHIQYMGFIHPITSEATDLSVAKHVQCCAEDGCEICAVDMDIAHSVLDDASIGDRFTEFMAAPRSRDHLQALFERVGIESEEFQFPSMTEE